MFHYGRIYEKLLHSQCSLLSGGYSGLEDNADFDHIGAGKMMY